MTVIRRPVAIGVAALAVLAGLAAMPWLGRPAVERPAVRAGLTVVEALAGAGDEGFARAEAPRPFTFPADHGPHPEYRIEWWYFTGNLRAAGGRRFGYQLTFFRTALAPEAPARASAWAARDVYMAHLALTDAAGGRFHAFERLSRDALGLAGARAEPFRVWVEDWVAEGEADDAFPVRLRAAAGDVAIDLVLTPLKPVVLQGDRGWSRKSAEPGNASYYYSLTRLASAGTVTAGGQTVRVEGLSWMDREWSTSALGPEQVGWDWFALQLADGSDLMYYRLRRRDGSADPHSAGTLVAPDGAVEPLGAADVVVETLDTWRSPRDGRAYPARWRLRVPRAGLVLEVRPLLADQELHLAVRYWEGAVEVRGERGGRAVDGHGYVELTGYGEPG